VYLASCLIDPVKKLKLVFFSSAQQPIQFVDVPLETGTDNLANNAPLGCSKKREHLTFLILLFLLSNLAAL
jgi:hypothetical protein